jgi:cation transporter-like permease
MKRKLILRLVLTVALTLLTPVLSANLFGWVYGRAIMDKGGASAEFIMGLVAGLWFAPVVFIVGTILSVTSYRKAIADRNEENQVQPGEIVNASAAAGLSDNHLHD